MGKRTAAQETAPAARTVEVANLPPDVAVRFVTADDGTVSIIRDHDDAVWDGDQFVVPPPPPVPYAVIVEVEAIDSPSAVAAVQAAIDAAKAEGVTVRSFAETVERVASRDRSGVAEGVRSGHPG